MNISCSTNNNNVVQYRLYAKNMAMDSAGAVVPEASTTPIQGGIIKIFANLNASYFVK